MIETGIYKSRIIINNTIFMYLRMLIVLIIGLYTSRVVLNILGATDFGIYSLVGGVIILFVFANQALNSAVQRFITFDLGKGDIGRLQKTFSMSITVYIVFAVVIIILLETIGLLVLSKLNIDEHRFSAAKWVYQAMVFTTFLNMLRLPYEALINAHEKMSFTAFAGIMDSLLKLIIVLVLDKINYDKLKAYSILFIIVTLFSYILYRVYCRVKFQHISSYKFYWDKHLFLKYIKFSGLSLYEQIAVMLSYQGIDILLNSFFGLVANAAMGITKQVQAALFNFISSFQGAMTPQITKSYASGDYKYLNKIIIAAPKFSLYLIFLFSIPIWFNIEELLYLWLVDVPPYTIVFCKLIIVSSIFESISLPFRTLIFASGNITRYQLVIGSTLLLNLILSFLFLRGGYDAPTVLWIRVFVYILVDIIRIYFVQRLSEISIIVFLSSLFAPVVLVLFVSSLVNFIFYFNTSFHLMINLLASFVSTGFFIYLLGINKLEKSFLFSLLKLKQT